MKEEKKASKVKKKALPRVAPMPRLTTHTETKTTSSQSKKRTRPEELEPQREAHRDPKTTTAKTIALGESTMRF